MQCNWPLHLGNRIWYYVHCYYYCLNTSPFKGQCSGSCENCWQYGADAECPKAGTSCSNYTDCASCAEQPGCGWCSVSGVCVPGTEYGTSYSLYIYDVTSLSGQCGGSCTNCWQYGDDATCPAAGTSCSSYTSCSSCAEQSGCGWCNQTKQCVPGTEYGTQHSIGRISRSINH